MDKIAEILLKISEETLENMSEPKRRLIQFLRTHRDKGEAKKERPS